VPTVEETKHQWLPYQQGQQLPISLASRVTEGYNHRHINQHNETDRQALQEVLEGGHWFRNYPGSWAQRFEEAWADYHDTQHCIATTNGTVSPQLALRAGGVQAGERVCCKLE